MNGKDHKMIFSGVCVQRCPPLNMAGNDVPDYPISFTYSNYSDSDSPSWNEAIGSMTIQLICVRIKGGLEIARLFLVIRFSQRRSL